MGEGVDSVSFSKPVTANITKIVRLLYSFNQTTTFFFALVQLLFQGSYLWHLFFWKVHDDRLRYEKAKQLGLVLRSHLCCWADIPLLATNHKTTTNSLDAGTHDV